MSLNKRQLDRDNPRKKTPTSPKAPIYNLEKMRSSVWDTQIRQTPNINLNLPQMGGRPRMFNPYGFANMIPLGPNEQGLLLGAGVNANIPVPVKNLNMALGVGATNLTGFQRQGMKPLFNEFRVEPPRLSLRYNFEHGGDHPTPEERYQATLDWLNTNPYEGMPDWKKLEEVKTSNYPSIGKSSGKMTIPIAGVTANPYDSEGKGYMYQPASMPTDYGGLNIVMVNKEGSDYTYPMVVAPQDANTKTRKMYKDFNQRYLHTMQDPKFLAKDPTFHVYGRGLPYNPALQEQYYEQYPSMNPNTQTALVQRYGGLTKKRIGGPGDPPPNYPVDPRYGFFDKKASNYFFDNIVSSRLNYLDSPQAFEIAKKSVLRDKGHSLHPTVLNAEAKKYLAQRKDLIQNELPNPVFVNSFENAPGRKGEWSYDSDYGSPQLAFKRPHPNLLDFPAIAMTDSLITDSGLPSTMAHELGHHETMGGYNSFSGDNKRMLRDIVSFEDFAKNMKDHANLDDSKLQKHYNYLTGSDQKNLPGAAQASEIEARLIEIKEALMDSGVDILNNKITEKDLIEIGNSSRMTNQEGVNVINVMNSLLGGRKKLASLLNDIVKVDNTTNPQGIVQARYGGQKYDHGGPHYKRGRRSGDMSTGYKGKRAYFDPTTLRDMQQRELEAQQTGEHAKEFYQGFDVGAVGDYDLMLPEYRLLMDQNYLGEYLDAFAADGAEHRVRDKNRRFKWNVGKGKTYWKDRDPMVRSTQDSRAMLEVPIQYDEEGRGTIVQDPRFGRGFAGRKKRKYDYSPIDLAEYWEEKVRGESAPMQFREGVNVTEKAKGFQKALHAMPEDKRRAFVNEMNLVQDEYINAMLGDPENNYSREELQDLIDREEVYKYVKDQRGQIAEWNKNRAERSRISSQNDMAYRNPGQTESDQFSTYNPLNRDIADLPSNRAAQYSVDEPLFATQELPDLIAKPELQKLRDYKRREKQANEDRFGTIKQGKEHEDPAWYDYVGDVLHSPGDFMDAFIRYGDITRPWDEAMPGMSYRDTKRLYRDLGEDFHDYGIFGTMSDLINPAGSAMDFGYNVGRGDMTGAAFDLFGTVAPFSVGRIGKGLGKALRYDVDKLVNPAFRSKVAQNVFKPSNWSDIARTPASQILGKNPDAARRGWNLMKDAATSPGMSGTFRGPVSLSNPSYVNALRRNPHFKAGLSTAFKNTLAAPMHYANMLSKPATALSLGQGYAGHKLGLDYGQKDPGLVKLGLQGLSLYNPFELATGTGFYSRVLPISREFDDLMLKGSKDFAMGAGKLYQGITGDDHAKVTSGIADIGSAFTPLNKRGIKSLLKNPQIKGGLDEYLVHPLMRTYGTESQPLAVRRDLLPSETSDRPNISIPLRTDRYRF